MSFSLHLFQGDHIASIEVGRAPLHNRALSFTLSDHSCHNGSKPETPLFKTDVTNVHWTTWLLPPKIL